MDIKFKIHCQQVSRAQILKKAADYISFMRRKNHSHQQDIDDLKKHNAILEQQSKLNLTVNILENKTIYKNVISACDCLTLQAFIFIRSMGFIVVLSLYHFLVPTV